MFDSNLMFRAVAAGDLAATVTLPANPGLDMGGPDLVPQTYQVHVPAFVAGSTLDIVIQESDNGVNWRTYLTMPQIAAIGEYFITGKSDARYRNMVFTVAGAGANFGVVQAGPVPAGRYTRF